MFSQDFHQYEITELSLVDKDNVELDLLPLFTELNIYEDIDSAFLNASLKVEDTSNLINNMKLSGNETVTCQIAMLTNKQPWFSTCKFRVDRIVDINFENGVEKYVLVLVSESFYNNSITRFSRKFSGNSVEIAKSIYNGFLSPTTPSLLTHGTSTQLSFSTPFWSPMRAIDYITKYTAGVGGDNTFMFFERMGVSTSPTSPTQQHCFFDLDVMVNNDSQYLMEYSNTSNTANSFNNIKELSITDRTTISDGIDSGSYASTLNMVDIYNRKFRTSSFSGATGSDRSIQNDVFKYTDAHQSRRSIMVDNGNLGGIQGAVSKRFLVKGNNITLTTYGHVGRSVGESVDVAFGIENLDKGSVREPNSMSGKYLVNKVVHVLNKVEYINHMELSRDNFNIGNV